jgi:hypothetical protein
MRWFDWLRGVDLPFYGRGLPPIAVRFVACERCGSLGGGVSGKGPWQNWRTAGAVRCRHDWQPRTFEAFSAEATERFGVDWTQESAWWQRLASAAHKP